MTQALQHQQAPLVLLDSLSTPCLLIDTRGIIAWGNAAVEALFSTSLAQITQTALSDWVESATSDSLETHDINNHSANSHANHNTSKHATIDSLLAQVQANPAQPIKLDIAIIATQIAMQAVLSGTENETWPIAVELINHAAALSAQAAEYRASQQAAQRELLRNLAHEIRNPLGGIRGAAQLLAREHKKLPQPLSTEYTDVIVAESTRLQTLLDRLLSAQAAPRTPSFINIHELCERVRSMVLAEYPNIRWQRDYDVSLPDILLDDHQMMQVLLNIVRNAAQILTEHNSPNPQITLRTRALRQATMGSKRHKLALELLVIDNGPGIPANMRTHLFSPLATQRAGGTGLGLHIAHSFVQGHGGVIEFDSEPGRTQFKVLLPW